MLTQTDNEVSPENLPPSYNDSDHTHRLFERYLVKLINKHLNELIFFFTTSIKCIILVLNITLNTIKLLKEDTN